MADLFSNVFLGALLFGAVTAAVPLLLAGLGEQMSEKAGVLNIGIEGMMIFGAYTGFLGAWLSDSMWLGFLAGMAGGMAAAMSTADGLLLAIANALSHDLYYKMIDPKAETARRLIVARILLLAIGIAGAAVASMRLTSILGAVAWAFDFACSGLFFPLVLGIWWKRANRPGAIAGMACGFIAGSWYLYMVRFAGMDPWLGIDHLRFGIVGMAASVVAMVAVTLMTKEPDAETQAMVDEIRIPKGETYLSSTH